MLNLSSEVFRKGLTADPSTSHCGKVIFNVWIFIRNIKYNLITKLITQMKINT
jgi:hypothetical protein